MAINLKKSMSFNIGAVVSSAISAAKEVRTSENAKKQSEFQKAIADGLSYNDQVKLLTQMADEEKTSTMVDEDFMNTLSTSITQTKKLARFETFRKKYSTSLASLGSGKTTAEAQLTMLHNEYDSTSDPDLKAEIQTDIVATEKELKTYNDTIISNTIQKAEKDGTVPVLNDAIDQVRSKRAQAAVYGNDEDVSYYDLQLTALTTQKVQAQVADATHDITVKALTVGVNAADKLGTLNNKINTADGSTPITIGGTKYNSEKEYWQTVQGAYLSGNGSGVFKDFFQELKKQTTDVVNASTARDGYVHTNTMDTIANAYDTLAAKPEMAPYLTLIQNAKTMALSDAVDSFSKAVSDRVVEGGFSNADNTLVALGSKYGIDVSNYRSDLAATMGQIHTSDPSALSSTDIAAYKKITGGDIAVPTIEKPGTPTTPTTPTAPALGGNTPAVDNALHTVVGGETLSAIAVKNNTSVANLLELNPELKANPNLIKVGQKIVTSKATVPTPAVPVVTPPVTPTTPPATPAPVIPTPAAPVVNKPTTPSTPAPVIPASTPATPTTPAVKSPATPTVQQPAPAAPVTPKVTAPVTPTGSNLVVKAGDNLSTIASKNGTTVSNLLSLNPQYKSNPNLIKVGETIKLK